MNTPAGLHATCAPQQVFALCYDLWCYVHCVPIHDMLLAPDSTENKKMHQNKDQKAVFHHYDSENIFARILRKELDCRIVLETAHTLAFHDRFPLAPVHVLVIPRGPYITAGDFFQHASEAEILDFTQTLARVVEIMDLQDNGYRFVANAGVDGGQVVPHFHMHVLGKKALGTFNGSATYD
jgi:histidine triad (HIT) family protein